MVRLLGIDLPKNKRIEYALTYIHGIGLTSAKKIVQLAEINPETRTNDITTEQSVVLRNILENFELNNPYKITKPLIQTSQDPRIRAEGKAGQSTDKGIIFVSSSNFESEAGAEWIIGTCVKSPCVAAGNNELVSAYR